MKKIVLSMAALMTISMADENITLVDTTVEADILIV